MIPIFSAIWRMAGDIDYLLRVVVKDMDAYDAFYKRLIKRVVKKPDGRYLIYYESV